MRHLILEKLTEVLEVHLGLERVNNGYKAVQLNLEVRVLYRSDNVRQLADAGRLDQDAVRMVLVHNIVQRLAEVANQRAADAACVHLVYNNAGILEEAAVNADLTELVLDQNNLLTLERIGQQTLDEVVLPAPRKPEIISILVMLCRSISMHGTGIPEPYSNFSNAYIIPHL